LGSAEDPWDHAERLQAVYAAAAGGPRPEIQLGQLINVHHLQASEQLAGIGVLLAGDWRLPAAETLPDAPEPVADRGALELVGLLGVGGGVLLVDLWQAMRSTSKLLANFGVISTGSAGGPLASGGQ